MNTSYNLHNPKHQSIKTKLSTTSVANDSIQSRIPQSVRSAITHLQRLIEKQTNNEDNNHPSYDDMASFVVNDEILRRDFKQTLVDFNVVTNFAAQEYFVKFIIERITVIRDKLMAVKDTFDSVHTPK